MKRDTLGTVKLSSLAAFSPPASTAKSLILSLLSSRILPQNGHILLNLTVPSQVPYTVYSHLVTRHSSPRNRHLHSSRRESRRFSSRDNWG